MAGRNRRKHPAEGFIPVPFLMGIILIAVLALAYLWLESQCESLGRQMKYMEAQKRELDKKIGYEEARWANMKAPAEIEKALRMHNLVMTWPANGQIVRMSSSDIAESLAEPRGGAGLKISRVAMNE